MSIWRKTEQEQVAFHERRQAGRELARLLVHLREEDLLVLALPRGGVPVGFEVAAALKAPLDVFIVRKLGAPGHEELAMGAIASGGVRVLNDDVVQSMKIGSQEIEQVTRREKEELARREVLYRGDRPPVKVEGRTVILVDDGLATGSTMKAAATALRSLKPRKLVVAVPVAAQETCEAFRHEVDEIICALTPDPFYAVGRWYEDFRQTEDEEVQELLAHANRAL